MSAKVVRDQGLPEPKPKPCARETWCTRKAGHRGKCRIKPRRELPVTDYGPKRRLDWQKTKPNTEG